MNFNLLTTLVVLFGFKILFIRSQCPVSCGKGTFFDRSTYSCIINSLELGAECDTLEDSCPFNTFCSPRYLRCMSSIAEGQRCPDIVPLNEVVLCNKIQHLYCLGGICRRIPNKNGISCVNGCGDPAEFFCNPFSGICEAYRLENQPCNLSLDFCNKSKGLYCASDFQCRRKY